jgi:signal transduction histidine kinase
VERLIGRSVAEVRGLDLPALLPVGQAAERALTAAREAGVRQSVLAEVADRGGQVLVEWVPGLGPGSGYVALSTPAPPANGETERIRLQARLISHVAHDLRGALAAVYAGLRTLVDDLQDGTEQRETAAKSLVEVQRASRIVEEVLALSRPGRLRRADLPLAQVVIQAVDRRRPEAAERAVDVRTSLDPEVVVSGDRSSLEAAVGNLLENALRAMPDGGTLAVSLQMEDRAAAGVLLTVADTGVGIPPDLQPTVFEAFVSDSPGGSGLGLTIARHVVLAHGGQIDFDSEIGVGTTFRVWLPRAT